VLARPAEVPAEGSADVPAEGESRRGLFGRRR
jgi:hypothetical protein